MECKLATRPIISSLASLMLASSACMNNSMYTTPSEDLADATPPMISHTVKIFVDHTRGVLRGDCTIECKGGNPSKGEVFSFQFMKCQIDNILIDGQAINNYDYKPYADLLPAESESL